MAVPRVTIWCTLLLLGCLGGCAASPEPQSPLAGPQATPPAPSAPPPRQPEPKPPEETTVVIDPGEEEDEEEPTLVEASRAERERRKTAQGSRIVITNDNLSDYSQEGQLTYVEEEVAATDGDASGEHEPPPGDREDDERYWRNRVLDLRLALRAQVDEIEALEERAQELRTRFYAEDDPYVRDGRIKPAWDRSLDLLAEAREEEKLLRRDLQHTLEEGREAGALPGWLREGIEIEPPPRPGETPGHEPREPTEAPEPIEPNSEVDGR